eukprot:jgi/Bigna1/88446/estExt_fgenesh1_pg.C_320047
MPFWFGGRQAHRIPDHDEDEENAANVELQEGLGGAGRQSPVSQVADEFEEMLNEDAGNDEKRGSNDATHTIGLPSSELLRSDDVNLIESFEDEIFAGEDTRPRSGILSDTPSSSSSSSRNSRTTCRNIAVGLLVSGFFLALIFFIVLKMRPSSKNNGSTPPTSTPTPLPTPVTIIRPSWPVFSLTDGDIIDADTRIDVSCAGAAAVCSCGFLGEVDTCSVACSGDRQHPCVPPARNGSHIRLPRQAIAGTNTTRYTVKAVGCSKEGAAMTTTPAEAHYRIVHTVLPFTLAPTRTLTTCQPTPHPILHPPMQPTPHPILHPPMQPTPHPILHPPMQPTPHPILHPPMQPTPHPILHPPMQPTPHPTSHPILHPPMQPTPHPILHPPMQPTPHPILHPPAPPPPATMPAADIAQQYIRNAFKHGYDNYANNCFGKDRLKPISGACSDDFMGLALTMIDAMDTMHIMNLTEDFDRATVYVSNMTMDPDRDVSVFETTIRVLGGLLSAHALSHNDVFKSKAVELANGLRPAFTSPLPCGHVNLYWGSARQDFAVNLAEIGTLQMELWYLSKITGNPFWNAYGEGVIQALRNQSSVFETALHFPGVYSTMVDRASATPNNFNVKFGGGGDSFYEYLLKMWIIQRDNNQLASAQMYRQMYLSSARTLVRHFIKRDGKGNAYIAEWDAQSLTFSTRMEHLTCFAPGMLALGYYHNVSSNATEMEEHLSAAKQLADTCLLICHSHPPSSSPSVSIDIAVHQIQYCTRVSVILSQLLAVSFVDSSQPLLGSCADGMDIADGHNYQRPETAESLYLLWKVTGEQRNLCGLQLCQRKGKGGVDGGYTSLEDVSSDPSPTNRIDEMKSFLLAEAFKYLYLMFVDDNSMADRDHINLHRYVFNTEAHPLPPLTPVEQ